jgi:hypothetical protein
MTMTSELAALARDWCETQTKRGWDVSPAFAGVYRYSDDVLTLEDWGIPGSVWSRAKHPVLVLHALKSQLELMASKDRVRHNCRGFAVCTEGWTFPYEHDHECDTRKDPASCPYLRWSYSGRKIADHPDGLEERNVVAADLDGRLVLASQLRGKDVRIHVDSRREDGELVGNVVNAICGLVDAIKAKVK